MEREISELKGITKTKEGRWRVRVWWQGKQYDAGTYERRIYAEKVLDKAKLEIALGEYVPRRIQKQRQQEAEAQRLADQITVGQWSKQWLQELKDDDKSEGTIVTYRSALRAHLLPTIGKKQLDEVTASDIKKIIDGIESAGARYNAYRVARAMYSAAVASKEVSLKVSPVLDVKEPKAPKRIDPEQGIERSKVLEEADLQAVTDAMPADLQIAVTLAGWCAARLGEVLGLQRHDFADLDNPEEATVTIERQWFSKAKPPRYADPKTGKSRRISIPPRIVPLIVEHLDNYVDAAPTSPILPSKTDRTKPIAQSSFDRHWRAARDTVRPGFRFHDLRHTGLTKYAQTGATLKEIMFRAGHDDEKVALAYQHATLERDRANVAKM